MARKPGRGQAESYVLALASEYEVRGEGRLPSVEALAHEAGVSRNTMWRAVRELVRRGALTSRRGSGIFVAPKGLEPRAASRDGNSCHMRTHAVWEKTLDTVRRDIYEGRYTPGSTLPSAKELAVSYGVSAPTMKKAVDGLVKERLVERRGRKLRVCPLSSEATGNRIVLVRRWFPWQAHLATPVRQMEDELVLESECERLGLKMSSVLCATQHGRTVLHNDRDGILSSRKAEASVMGFLVWPMALAHGFDELWGRLVETGKPIAVMATALQTTRFLSRRRGALTALVRLSDEFTAGAAVGRYVLAHGHTRAAFLNTAGGSAWARLRLEGLRSVFAKAGYGDGITVFHGPAPVHEGMAKTDMPPFAHQVVQLLERASAGSTSSQKQQLVEKLLVYVRAATSQMQNHGDIRTPVLEAAPRDDISVWVADSDETAIECQSRLWDGVCGSRAVSVIGFGNIAESVRQGLTTYDMGNAAAIRASLGFLLRPSSFRRRTKGVCQVQMEGSVVERGSVWKVGAGLRA